MTTALFNLINNWIIFVISNQFVVAVVFGRTQERLMQVKVENVRLERAGSLQAANEKSGKNPKHWEVAL